MVPGTTVAGPVWVTVTSACAVIAAVAVELLSPAGSFTPTGAVTVDHDTMSTNHAQVIRDQGNQACAYCHQPVYCARCHAEPGDSGALLARGKEKLVAQADAYVGSLRCQPLLEWLPEAALVKNAHGVSKGTLPRENENVDSLEVLRHRDELGRMSGG